MAISKVLCQIVAVPAGQSSLPCSLRAPSPDVAGVAATTSRSQLRRRAFCRYPQAPPPNTPGGQPRAAWLRKLQLLIRAIPRVAVVLPRTDPHGPAVTQDDTVMGRIQAHVDGLAGARTSAAACGAATATLMWPTAGQSSAQAGYFLRGTGEPLQHAPAALPGRPAGAAVANPSPSLVTTVRQT